MSEHEGCPDGMYPLDVYYDDSPCKDFAELKIQAESTSDVLNLPLSWYFSDPEDEDDSRSEFSLVMVMPRKQLRTWSMRTKVFDRDEVQQWLDTWVRQEINEWFGWA